ncbi:MAG: tetratricopeptide repeat protein, partial [Sulfitobacter sp.]|nr:tetratricopeptide repeat protein [Sulfitobacter sp.]
DGDLDLFLRSRTNPRLQYLENRLPLRGKSVQFKLVGRSAEHTTVGARLTVRDVQESGPSWIRTLRAGEGYLAQSSAWLHVGGGDTAQVQVQVRWPSGEVSDYGIVSAGSSRVLVEGETESREWIRPEPNSQAGTSSGRPGVNPAAGDAAGGKAGRVVLAAPLPLPQLAVTTKSGKNAVLGGVAESLHGQERAPMILLLWSPDCAPCLKELAAWSEAREAIRSSGLSVLALRLDSESSPSAQSDWLETIQWPYARGSCSEETARIFAALTSQVMGSTRPLAVPMALLVDQRGRAQVLYRGGVDPAQALKDMEMFPLQGPARLRASVPFDGLYLDPYKQPDWVLLARSFRAGGLPQVAKEYELALVRTESLDSSESQFEFGQARMRQRNFELALQHFEEAVKAGPGVLRYLEPLGVCQYQLGQWDRARETFRAVLELDPRQANTLYNLGFLLARESDFTGARTTLQRLRPVDQNLATRLRLAISEFENRAKQAEESHPPLEEPTKEGERSTEPPQDSKSESDGNSPAEPETPKNP